jgi:type II secretory pathway pseudopilin PulG
MRPIFRRVFRLARNACRDSVPASAGLSLIEVVVAIAMLGIIGLGVVQMMSQVTKAGVMARNRVSCPRTLDSSFAQLKNMNFFAVFPVYSSATKYGLTLSASPFPYPTTGYMNIQVVVSSAGYSYYNTAVTYMRRDTSDANNNGYTNDLTPIVTTGTPGTAGSCDKYDPNVCWMNPNADTHYPYGTYADAATGNTASEVPNTHLKMVTVNIYDMKHNLACTRTELISLEQLTGMPNADSEAFLKIDVDTPTNGGYIYADTTTAQISARGLVFASTYSPTETAVQYRADSAVALTVGGTADPSDTIDLTVGNFSPVVDTLSADFSGNFSGGSSLVTAKLVEGINTLNFRAVNGSFNSPWTSMQLIYDIKAPVSSTPTPTSTSGVVQSGQSGTATGLRTLSPYVSLTLKDNGYSTTTTSGIDPNVTAMFYSTYATGNVFAAGSRINGTSFNSVTGVIVALSSSSLPPIISSSDANGNPITYTLGVEFGDYAGYKSSATWQFVLAPVINAALPIMTIIAPLNGAVGTGPTPLIRGQVFDGNSGINPYSITLSVTQLGTVCSNQIGNLSSCYDQTTGYVSYTSTTPLVGTQSVTLNVRNWAGTLNAVQTWQFTP